MKNDFESLYNEIISLTGKVEAYCLNHELASDERLRNLLDAAENLHDTAHEVEEHLAWD